MGNEPSREEREEMKKKELEIEKEVMESFRRSLKDAPDFRVNQNIQMFTGLSCVDNLRHHYQQRKMEASDFAADWSKNLVEKLAALEPAPELAGLGALAIAVIIDASCFSPAEESTKEALRSVFAEEKVSKVWDLVDECLKRTFTYINQREELVSTMKDLERQLSSAITSLKNSMVMDGHMSTSSLRVWVNAAAFHVHMLVHLVRLGGIQTADPAERLLVKYESDLASLFTEHEKMTKAKCQFESCEFLSSVGAPGYTMYFLVDEESIGHELTYFGYPVYLEAYYDQRFGRQQRHIQQYFTNLKMELPRLVHQTGTFP